MGQSYGRQVLGKVGQAIMAAASMLAHWKVGGITLAWETVTAAVAETVLPDGNTIAAGKKGLRFGQILCRITTTEVQTVDLSGDDDPTGGTFDLEIAGQPLEDIPWNVSAAALQALIRGLDFPGAAGVTVAKAGFVYTLTFTADAGDVELITADASNLTGGVGDTFAITVANAQPGGRFGEYGPYDPTATDGRQTLRRGECFILNETVLEDGPLPGLGGVTNHPAVFDGGPTWKARLLITSGAASLEAGPTVADFEAAFPRVEYVQNA